MVGLCTAWLGQCDWHVFCMLGTMWLACVQYIQYIIGIVWTACVRHDWNSVVSFYGMFGTEWLVCVRHVWDSVVGLCTACLGQCGWLV